MTSAAGKITSRDSGNGNKPCGFASRSLHRSGTFATRCANWRWRISRCNHFLHGSGHMADQWPQPKMKTRHSACIPRQDALAVDAPAILNAGADVASAAFAYVVSKFPEKSWRALQIPINSNEKRAALAQYLESERPNHRLLTRSDYSSTSSLLSLPPPAFTPTPTAARILASISCAISGFSFRNLRVLSLP